MRPCSFFEVIGMSVVTLQEAMEKLKMDEGVPTADLELELAAAEQYVANALGRPIMADDSLAKTAVLMLLCSWHVNPDGGEASNGTAIRAVTAVIKQLKYKPPSVDLEGGVIV